MNNYNMQLTLEEHFHNLSERYDNVNELYSLWIIIKKDLSEKLNNINSVFPYYSKHDESHARTIITNIELFLGEERICKLSATDTFMLLICAYLHDYGMALDLEELYLILNDDKKCFQQYLSNIANDNTDAKRLLDYYEKKSDGNLKELYRSIIITIQEYIRPEHWKGVEKITKDFDVIFRGRIKARFINNIVSICQMHGRDISELLNLNMYSTGIFSDLFHPRFIAAMIRLGDLLDLDNSRFSRDFFFSFYKHNNIPDLSKIHFMKHEAISNLYIGTEHIDIEARCNGENSLQVARAIHEWINWLEKDCEFLKSKWDRIAQKDFGMFPRIRKKHIYVDGIEYQHFLYQLKMELPSDRIFALLTGSNVYKNKYVAFREIIQNAIDASLLQMWKSFKVTTEFDNNVVNYCLSDQYKSYKIHVNVIEDSANNCVYVEVIDNGIGIDDDDLKYMCKIGLSNMSNPKRYKIIQEMPKWLIPSGVFGIGLQSAFQLTDEIEFYTKKANRTPRYIRFSSYSSNKGIIEVAKCPNSFSDHFNKLTTQGTMVRMRIDSNKFKKINDFDYIDLEFDNMPINSRAIRIEIVKQFVEFFSVNRFNYFPVYFSDYEIDKNKICNIGRNKKLSMKYYNKLFETMKEKNQIKFETRFKNFIYIYFWDDKRKILLTIRCPKCEIINKEDKFVRINKFENAFNIRYKFIEIDNYRALYQNEKIPYAQMLESNMNIIKCTVDIFDSDSVKYLNIDRNTLKYGKLKFSDIIDMEKKAFTKICEMLNNYKYGENNRTHLEINKFFNIYYFPIISLLMARFSNVFTKFKDLHKEIINNISIEIGNLKFSLSDIINDGISIYEEIAEENGKFEITESLDRYVRYNDLIRYFPRHFFVPTKVEVKNYDEKSYLITKCKIRQEWNHIITPELHDSYLSIEYSLIKSKKISLVRTVLNPDNNFQALIVDRCPKTFLKHSLNTFDDNISIYILSPFDDKSAQMFYKCIEENAVMEELTKYLNNDSSAHFEKCIEFVSKHSISNNQFTIKEIKDLYIEYIQYLINKIKKL